MKVKATVELGTMIQSMDTDIPDEVIQQHPLGEEAAIRQFLYFAIMKDMKLTWKELGD